MCITANLQKVFNQTSTMNHHTLEPNRYIVKLSFDRIDEIKKFLRKNSISDLDTGCLLWKRGCHERGYGHIRIDGKNYRVHRVSAHIYKDFPLDSKFLICHKCDNPRCFRPSHLFIGTQKDNSQDAARKRKLKNI